MRAVATVGLFCFFEIGVFVYIMEWDASLGGDDVSVVRYFGADATEKLCCSIYPGVRQYESGNRVISMTVIAYK